MGDGGIDKEKSPRVALEKIRFPSLHSSFSSLDECKYLIAHKVGVTIIDDNELRILFGVSVRSDKTIQIGKQSQPADIVQIEAIGIFEFEEDIPTVRKVEDIPLVANLLALIYPFLREKVSYCFTANNIQFFLEPVNIFAMLKKFSKDKSFLVTDNR